MDLGFETRSGRSGSECRDAGKEGLIAEPDVAAAAQLVGGVVEVDRTSLAVRAIDDLKGSTSFTVTRGRMPTGPDDVVLGRITMDDLEVDLGGRVVAVDTDGTDHSMTVVGEAVLPTTDFGGNPGTGAAVTSDTFGRSRRRLGSEPGADVSGRRRSDGSSADWSNWDLDFRCTPDRNRPG